MFSSAQKLPFPRDYQSFKQRHPLSNLSIISFGFFPQLAQARQEAEVAESRAQQLREQVEDLQEKVAAQAAGNHGDVSLLSELEASLEAADLGVSEEEVSRSLLRLFQSAKLNFSIWAAGGVWYVFVGGQCKSSL